MEKIAEFDKEIIATVCGSFRRGIDNGLLLSDDCNNPEADPGFWIGWPSIQFSSFSFSPLFFFLYFSLPCSFSVFHVSVDSKI